MTQAERIKTYMMDFGEITPLDAFRDLGITKLATRISEMRKNGEIIADEWITTKNRYGDKVRFKKYKMGALG